MDMDAYLISGSSNYRNLEALDWFYKKGSQEKTLPHRPELFLLHSPLD
jgi:hypothetical protein